MNVSPDIRIPTCFRILGVYPCNVYKVRIIAWSSSRTYTHSANARFYYAVCRLIANLLLRTIENTFADALRTIPPEKVHGRWVTTCGSMIGNSSTKYTASNRVHFGGPQIFAAFAATLARENQRSRSRRRDPSQITEPILLNRAHWRNVCPRYTLAHVLQIQILHFLPIPPLDRFFPVYHLIASPRVGTHRERENPWITTAINAILPLLYGRSLMVR